MDIKIAQMDVLKSLEDFRVILERVAMVSQWELERKKSWEYQGTATCQEPLRLQTRFWTKPGSNHSGDHIGE
jgi:hypothetical protein